MRTFAVLAMALVLSLGLKADDKLANPKAGECPVGHKPIKEGCVAEVDGKKYGFCCGKCMKAFKEDPKKYLKEEKKEK